MLVIADEHAGLAGAVRRFLPEVRRQRCTVHLQRKVVIAGQGPAFACASVWRQVAAVFRAPGLAESKKRRGRTARCVQGAPRGSQRARGARPPPSSTVPRAPLVTRLRTTASSACTPRSSVGSGAPAPSPTEPARSGLHPAVALSELLRSGANVATWNSRLEPKEVAKAAFASRSFLSRAGNSGLDLPACAELAQELLRLGESGCLEDHRDLTRHALA